MARAKASTRKSRSPLDQDRYTAELSTGQLVIGVCILLMFGLACFLMGVLIGKFDPELRPDTMMATPDRVETSHPAEPPISETMAKTISATDTTQSPKAPPPEMRVPQQSLQRNPPPSDPAPTVREPNKTTPVAKRIEPPTKSTVEVPDTPKPKSTSPTVIPGRETPVKAATTASATAPKRFAVQIAAFQTRSRAEVVKSELESKSAYRSEIQTSDSGHHVVVVGSYAETASATKVRDDLRDHYGYSDCFVVPK